MSEEFKPLWKRVNWNNTITATEEEEFGERTPLIRESTAIQVDNDSDKISALPRQSRNISTEIEKTTDEVHKTIGKLLVRGDDLDDMRQKAGFLII
jgi:flagellar biosynthesis/type III secretory pathway M-ring protein FliF/YscJ